MNFTAKWDVPAQKMFGAGVDRGMVYTPSGPAPWIGLVSVNVEGDDGVFTPRYLDGIPVTIASTPRDARGSIEAFTYPDELAVCLGEALPDGPLGIIATGQPRQPFDMSYREMIGHSGTLKDEEYIIHLLYDVHLQDDGRTHNTLADTSDPDAFAWSFLTSSRPVSGLRPTSYFKIDTRKTHPTRVRMVEELLYGVDDTQPQMPPIDEIRELLEPFQVTYEWTGVAHASESIQKIDGVETRRNLTPNPSFEIDTAGWTVSGGTASTTTAYTDRMWGGLGGRMLQLVCNANADWSHVIESFPIKPIIAGEWLGVSVMVANRPASIGVRLQIHWTTQTGAEYSATLLERASFYEGHHISAVQQAPEGATGYRVQVQHRKELGLEGQTMWVDHVMVVKAETQAEAQAILDLGYFDGDTSSHTSWYPDGRRGD